jgi:hypothetical protein
MSKSDFFQVENWQKSAKIEMIVYPVVLPTYSSNKGTFPKFKPERKTQ